MPIINAPLDRILDQLKALVPTLEFEVRALRKALAQMSAERNDALAQLDAARRVLGPTAGSKLSAISQLGAGPVAEDETRDLQQQGIQKGCPSCGRPFTMRSARQLVCVDCRPKEHRAVPRSPILDDGHTMTVEEREPAGPESPAIRGLMGEDVIPRPSALPPWAPVTDAEVAAEIRDLGHTIEPAVLRRHDAPKAAEPERNAEGRYLLAPRPCVRCGQPFRPAATTPTGWGKLHVRCEPCRKARMAETLATRRSGKSVKETPESLKETPASLTHTSAPENTQDSSATRRQPKFASSETPAPPPVPKSARDLLGDYRRRAAEGAARHAAAHPEPPPPEDVRKPSSERRCSRCCAKFTRKDSNDYFCTRCHEIRAATKQRHVMLDATDAEREAALEPTAWKGRGPIVPDKPQRGLGSSLAATQFKGF